MISVNSLQSLHDDIHNVHNTKLLDIKNQGNVIHFYGGNNMPTQDDPNFKAAIIFMLNEINKYMLMMNEKIRHLS